MYLYLLRIHIKRSEKDLFDDDYAIFLIFFIKAYVVGTHLNCIDKSMQFKWEPTTYAFIKKINKKYTGCNKTTEFHECALIGVCAVIRSNTVGAFFSWCRKWHNHESQLSRGIKIRRGEEQIMTKQIPNMKPPTHKERITVTEEMLWNGGTLNAVVEARCLFKIIKK